MIPPLISIPNFIKMTKINDISENPRMNLKDFALNMPQRAQNELRF